MVPRSRPRTARAAHRFKLSETSTAQLDAHILNAVINDPDMCKPEARLKLAVEWSRIDVVAKVLQEGMGSDKGLDVRLALQTAVANRDVEITKLLLAQNLSLVTQLDFIVLYSRASAYTRLLSSNSRLQDDLSHAVGEQSSAQRATSARRYAACLARFLRPLVPDMDERIVCMAKEARLKLKREAAAEGKSPGGKGRAAAASPVPFLAAPKGPAPSSVGGGGDGGRAPSPAPPMLGAIGKSVTRQLAQQLPGQLSSSMLLKAASMGREPSLLDRGPAPITQPGLDDLFLWAVLIRSVGMAEVLWQSMVSHGDPIRMALVADRVARNAAKAPTSEPTAHTAPTDPSACSVHRVQR